MPKGVYDKTHLYRSTDKLKNGVTILRAHDSNFKLTELMTNEEVYGQLSHFGFRWRNGMWRKPIHRNGQSPLVEPEYTIQPMAGDKLEMVLPDDKLDSVQQIIQAMHILGFTVEVKLTGIRN